MSNIYKLNKGDDSISVPISVLYQDAANKCCIKYYNNYSTKTFITFHGIRGDIHSKGFGLDFLLKSGYNVIACTNAIGSYYQSLSFEAFKEAVCPVVAEKQVFLYGSSLGGYCAIYYAGAVNGTVLAASPRNSAHPLLQNKEGAHSFNHSYHIKENELTSNNIYILSDPSNKRDVLFLEKIISVSYPNVYVYKFPHVGHANLLRHLQEHDKLGDLIRYVVNNKVDAINRLFEQPIKSSFYLLGNAKYHSVKLNEYLSLLSKMEDKMGVENTERYKKLKNDVYINKELVNKQYALIKKQEQTINKLLYKEKRLKESTSWKVTKPLRIAGGVYRRLIRYLANVMRQIGARVAR